MKDLYRTLSTSGKSHDVLYHYTSIDTLELILKNKSMMLKCLTKVNDLDENKRITSLWNSKVFVSCFTHSLDNELYFFENYGKVRISFYNKFDIDNLFFDSELKLPFLDFHKHYASHSVDHDVDYSDRKNWCLYNSCIADVFYTTDLNLHKRGDGELNAGLIKQIYGVDTEGNIRNWSIEEETRIRVAIRPIAPELKSIVKGKAVYHKPPFSSLFFSIKETINSIELFDCCSESEKEHFNSILKRYS